jgi:ferritin-like metal-binding protein YciE
MPTKTATKAKGRPTAAAVHKVTVNKAGAMEGQNLRDLLVTKLQALYDVENQIIKALPKLAKKAGDADLQEAITRHLHQTEGHAERLEQAFGIMEMKMHKMQSGAIRGLSEDADWVVKNTKGKEALDAALIAALRSVEHYEIAAYGAAREWAELIGERQVAELLEETLHEEEEAADALADLALSKVNGKAAGEGSFAPSETVEIAKIEEIPVMIEEDDEEVETADEPDGDDSSEG